MPKEYIESEKLLGKVKYIAKIYNLSEVILSKLQDAMDRATAADVVEVVRCRECKHGKYDEEENKVLCIRMKNIGDGELYVYNEPEDYCSYGEREDGAE